MRERFKAKPDAVMCEYLFGPTIQVDCQRSFYNMGRMNLAHAMMLKRQGIIPEEDAKTIIRALAELLQQGPGHFAADPEMEDYYMNTENYLISRIGVEVAGKLHTARSRNDLHSTVARMNVRDTVLNLTEKLLKLRGVLLALAEEHKETVVTGYTHMQPAQPMTLGHYFAAIAGALERDCQRIAGAYGRMNLSTLGACAFAGTSFPVDRYYTAEMLGFSGIVVNTIDAIAARDYLMELSAAYAILGSNLNRFAIDLYYWTTDEFHYVEVADSLAASSSIMPQKKNPVTLEHTKAKSAHLLADFASIAGCMKGVPYGHNREVAGETLHGYYDAAGELEAMLELMTRTLELLVVRKEHLKERADRNFCTVTELADEIVKREGFSFRVAHQIVGNIVMQLVEKDGCTRDITAGLLDAAAGAFAGRPLGWSQADIDRVLDSAYSVEHKVSCGAPSPVECAKMIRALSEGLERDRADDRARREALAEADRKLEAAVREALG